VPKLPCAMTAEELLQDATAQGGDCTELYRWNAELEWCEGHVIGLPFGNFALREDGGYFLRCAQAMKYVPGEEGVCMR